MNNRKQGKSIFAPFRQLRWRLTLSFTLVTFAALLMVLWWSFLLINFYLNATTAQANLPEVRAEFYNTILPVAFPAALILFLPAIAVAGVFGFITARWLESRLNRLREATDAWGDGYFKVRIHDEAQDEIAHFGRQLNQMASEMEALLRTRQELAALEERNQLARELHDSVKQQLAAAALQIGAAQSLIERDPAAAWQALTQAATLAHQAQTELSNIILELRPAALHEKGLTHALRTYLDQWSQQSGIGAGFSAADVPQLPFNSELIFFRVAQEALANVARHSQASQVKVQLSLTDSSLELTVEDNGRGFDPAQINSTGFGLTSMSDRLETANGRLEVSRAPNGGTRIAARLPLPAGSTTTGVKQ